MGRRILLVHGLWMHAPALYFWARQLREAGYRPQYFSYRSLLQSPEQAIARLRETALAEPDTDILAHSLGGLIAVEAMAGCPSFRGRILCVGSPLAGSQVVRRYRNTPLGVLAGRSTTLLSRGFTQIPEGLDVSVIAGTDPKGLGRFVHRFDAQNDGSVALSETRIPGLQRHVSVPVSHSGQLFSKAVMTQVLALLNREA
ncbi:alpha/beta hydrolase [Arenimonas sp. GDDSR-1]|uniref:esterase/lipase family protein n=1 Tax=Arenimonas sp. GDDSR-1 TaxID=2950125 RepID=UPI002631086E|nr:alpha/beta hydrolase [Arenimonas sp. GDDSR-1]